MGVFNFLLDEIILCSKSLPGFIPDFGILGPAGLPADYAERQSERLTQRARLYTAQQAACYLLDFENRLFE